MDEICGTISGGVSKWEPHTLPHCLDSYWLAVVTCVLAVVVVIQYGRVAVWFGRSATLASSHARQIFIAKAVIFAACGLAGYGARALAWEAPGLAAIQQVVFMAVSVVACEWMFWLAKGHTMPEIMSEQNLGRRVIEAYLEDMTPEQIADLVRVAANRHLEWSRHSGRGDDNQAGVGSG